MAWAERSLPYRRVGTIALITLLHVGALSWAASLKIYAPSSLPRDSLLVEFADIILPEPEPDPIAPPEPEPVAPEPDPQPPEPTEAVETPPDPPMPNPVQEPLSEPATAVSDETPSVLTQNPTEAAANLSDQSAPEGGAITDAQIAGVLQQLNCQKLRHRPGEICPQTDPFDAAASVASRLQVERVYKYDPDHVSKTVSDKVYEREVQSRLHWPDPDLFADPLPPGAYGAQRIRNGQEPLWSKEMRDGFRKDE